VSSRSRASGVSSIGIAHTNATRPSPMARQPARFPPAPPAPWLTGSVVRYYAGDWSVEELAAIQRELERQRVTYTMDGDDMLVDPHHERMVDMIVESITET